MIERYSKRYCIDISYITDEVTQEDANYHAFN